MDQIERKEKHLPLPPNYVSLAQLQERWLQKQREKEMSDRREKEMREEKEKEMREEKEKEMREKKENDSEKQQRDAGLNENQNQRGFLKNGWRDKKASIQEKGKGKEIVVDGLENKKNDSTNNNKKKKKKKRRDNRKKKFEKGTEKLETETTEGFNGGIKGGFSGENGGNEGLKGPTEEIVNRIDSRGGYSKNGNNRGAGDNSQRQDNNRVRFNQLKETEVNLALEKMEDKKRHNWTWIERRRNSNDRSGEGRYSSKENGQDVSKDDVLELKLEQKAGIENSEIYSEIGNLKGGDRNGLNSNDLNRVAREGLNNNGSTLDKKVDGVVLPLESVGISEKGVVGNGYRRRYVNNGRRFRGGDWKENVADVRRGGFEGRFKMKEEKSGMIWVKKADKPGAYVDARFGSSGISAEQE